MGISDDLERLREDLEALGRNTLLEAFGPARSDADVRAYCDRLGLTPDPGFVALYGWHDGVARMPGQLLDDIHLIPGFYLLTLAEAEAERGRWATRAGVPSGALPVLSDAGGDFYAVRLDGSGRVCRLYSDDDEWPEAFTDLESMIRTFVTAFDLGIFYLDREAGYLEADDERFFELAAELNRTATAWSD